MKNEDPLFIKFLKNPTDDFINRLIALPDEKLEKILKVDLGIELKNGLKPPYDYEEKVYIVSVIKENSDNDKVIQILDKTDKK
jgi:hypothetical protein